MSNRNNQINNGKIALIHIEDKIDDAFKYLSAFKQATRPEYNGVLLHINSPGGFSGTSDLLFLELKRIKETKPVVVIVENMCCSAAYQIACAADLIIAPPGADIGSIGVKIVLDRNKKTSESEKENVVILYAGKYKVAGDPNAPLSEDHKAYFQNLLNEDHSRFMQEVAHERGLSLEESNIWANGKIFKAPRAKDMKLIDALGCYSDAIDILKDIIIEKENINQQFDIITIPLEK